MISRNVYLGFIVIGVIIAVAGIITFIVLAVKADTKESRDLYVGLASVCGFSLFLAWIFTIVKEKLEKEKVVQVML